MLKKLSLLVVLLLINCLVVTVAHSRTYKWVDNKGQVHYTQTPPQKSQMNKDKMAKALSSSKKDSKTVSTLVGNWVGTRKNENVLVEFYMDGRFEDRIQTGTGFIQNGTGMWQLDGEMIKWEYPVGHGKWRYAGRGKHFSFIEKMEDNLLHIREPNGEITKLTRVDSIAEDAGISKEKLRAAICNKGFDKMQTPGQKWVALIKSNCIDKAKELLTGGLDSNAESGNKTPLTLAIEMKKKAFVKFLIKNGADLNKPRKSDGATPLILAAKMGEYQLVNTLIGVGASIDANDMSKNTALIIAAKENQEMIVKRLLSMGANVNAQDGEGLTALKHAKQRGYRKIVNTIMDYKKLTGSK